MLPFGESRELWLRHRRIPTQIYLPPYLSTPFATADDE